MTEATPVTEKSTMTRSSKTSYQIASELQVVEIHLKTNDNSTYGEANSAYTALGQVYENFPAEETTMQCY